MDRSITLAGFVILKLVRSPLAAHLDLRAGEKAYHLAIQHLKNVSLQPNDIYIRTALIMRDLWGSNRVFRKKNGEVESLGLQLRSRLGMSVAYDMFWYWREEFSNMKNPYSGEEATVPSNDPTRPTTPREHHGRAIDTPMLTMDSAYSGSQAQEQQAPSMNSQIPLNKFDPSLVPMQPDPALVSYENNWDPADYHGMPVMEQFPDYDWASGFEFTNTEFPNIPLGAVGGPMMPGNVNNMGYNTFG
jgi:transcriptional regulatory protein LEU3